ncbi:MAG: heavy metal translocating P-type ATPase [Treponema sp.]|nr:heavy metal translocating P-type ATPase [Treponema sp.]
MSHEHHEHKHNHEHEHQHEHECGHCCCHSHEHEHGHDHGCCHGEEEGGLKKIIIAAVLFAAALLLEHLPFFKNLAEAGAGRPIFGQSLVFGQSFDCSQAFSALKLLLFAAAYLLCAKEVLINAVQNILRGQIFDEQFLMAAASIAAIAIGEYPEAVGVMLFYQVGEWFEDYAVDKSRDSIQSLVGLRPDKAFVLRGGQVLQVAPEEVKIGETIQVKPGERVPLDGLVLDGDSFVDTSALTGESVPRQIGNGSIVMAGFVNQSGLITIKVTKAAADSSVSRILELVENAAEKKAKAQKFISRFAKVYTPLVCIAAALVAVVPPIFVGAQWSTWIYRAIMFLVVSCPCALVISVPLSFYGGIGLASSKGILIKGSNYIELLSKAKIAAFDKTGTLTQGVFVVNEIHPSPEAKISQEELIAIATHAEKYSEHPISKSLKIAHHCPKCESLALNNVQEFRGKGIKVEIEGQTILAGNLKLMEAFNVQNIVPCSKDDIGTIVHIAIDGIYQGHIVISDKIKEASRDALAALKKAGVKKTVMLTGDSKTIAEANAKLLGVDQTFAELLPEEKVARLEELIAQGPVLFAGDGINDAPVLARADVGIAMGALGSDAAIEASDVVIMNDDLNKIPAAIKIAKKTMGVVWQNIAMSLLVKFGIMALAVPGIANLWLAVFGDVGVLFLAVLNALRLSLFKREKN